MENKMDKELENKLRINFEEALNRFNFAKIYSVMEFLDWCWYDENHSPTQEQMIESVKERFESALKNLKASELSISGSGGFFVELFKSGKVRIQFIVDESEFGYEG
jgi:hypothetical protein